MNKNKHGEKRYGLFTSIALVLGIVIGSGIYVKNDAVLSGTGNPIDAIIAWVIGTVLVLAIILSFLEIMSISKKNKKPGTLLYWSNKLIGPRVGKVLGIIGALLYISINLAAFPMWSADKMLAAGNISEATVGVWPYFWATIGLAIGIMLFIFSITTFSKRGTKGFSILGLSVKTIPLFVVIIAALVFIPLAMTQPIDTVPVVPVEELPYGENSAMNILTVIPAILFTYNGFLTSASMMNESKDYKTYKWAFVSAMVFAAAIYIWYTISIFMVGTTTLEEAIYIIFGEQASWVWPIMESFVIISIMTSLLGTATAAPRQFSSLSANGLIADKNGKFLRRNNQMVPQYSAYRMLTFSFIWLFVLSVINAIGIHTGNEASMNNVMYSFDSITNYTAILVYTTYAIVIAGGLWNRHTKKVDTDKNWYFIPAAIVAVLGTLGIMGIAVYDSFYSLIVGKNFIDLVTFIIVLAAIPAIYYFSIWEHRYIQRHHLQQKKKFIEIYDSMVIAKEFQKGIRPFLISPKYAKDLKWSNT